MFKRVAPQTPGTAGIPQTEAMTSRPAAPESETPLVLGLQDIAFALQKEGSESWAIICREAATALSLAQTEIKGHMRTEDELKRDIAIYQASIEKFAMQHQRKVMGLESRIAELEKAIVGECEDCGHTILTPLHPLPSVEKDAARYRWLRDSSWPMLAYQEDQDTLRVTQQRNIKLGADAPTGERLDAAIDAALKSRA